jgi:hypothetical protein
MSSPTKGRAARGEPAVSSPIEGDQLARGSARSSQTRPDQPDVAVVELGATVPDWTLRLLLAAVAGMLCVVLSTEGVPPGGLIIFGLVGLAAIFVPASPAATVLGCGTAILLALYSEGDPVRPAVLACVVLVHLLHVVSGQAAVIPRGTRIHPRALRRPALRFVLIQAVVFALVGLAMLLPHAATPMLIEVGALLAVTSLAVFVMFLLRRS